MLVVLPRARLLYTFFLFCRKDEKMSDLLDAPKSYILKGAMVGRNANF